MKIQTIKQINIVVVFSEPINHLLITPKEILELFKKEEKLPQHSLIEAPGLKVFIFPNEQKDLVFEAYRIILNDKSKKPEESEIIDDLENILTKGGIVDRTKISAYGFNYFAVANSEKKNIEDLISSKITGIIENIKRVGIQIVFQKENTRETLYITPIEVEAKDQFLIQLNLHYPQFLVSLKELKERFIKNFNEFINLVEKI